MAEVEKKEAPKVEKVEATVKDAVATNNNADLMAIASLVLGVLNLCAFCMPYCCLPLSILGLVLGYLGRKSTKYKTIAIIGMVLCGLGLVLSICGLMSMVFGWTDNSWNYDWNY